MTYIAVRIKLGVTFYPRFSQQKRNERSDTRIRKEGCTDIGFDVFVNVTGSVHPEAINMSSWGIHAYTHFFSHGGRRDVLLSHKGQGRDNYGARGTPVEEENIYACARGRREWPFYWKCACRCCQRSSRESPDVRTLNGDMREETAEISDTGEF